MSIVLSISASVAAGMPSRRPMTLTEMSCSMIVVRSSIMYCSSKVHQEIDLTLRPLPVFARQTIERQLLDSQPGAFLGGAPHALDAAAMPFDPRQSLSLSPSAVAIHDDRDMPRQLCSNCRQRGSGGESRFGHASIVGRAVLAANDRHGAHAAALETGNVYVRYDLPASEAAEVAKIVCSRSGPTDTTSTGLPTSSLKRAK